MLRIRRACRAYAPVAHTALVRARPRCEHPRLLFRRLPAACGAAMLRIRRACPCASALRTPTVMNTAASSRLWRGYRRCRYAALDAPMPAAYGALARQARQASEWFHLKEGIVPHKILGSPPPPPPPEDSPSGAPSPGRVGYGLRKGCLYVPRSRTPGGSRAERSCSRYV